MYVDMLQIVFLSYNLFYVRIFIQAEYFFFLQIINVFIHFFSGLQNSALVFFAIENPFILKEIECFLSTTMLPFISIYVFEIPQFIWSVR